MRKILSTLFAVCLCVSIASAWNPFDAEDAKSQPPAIAHGTFSTSQSTPVATACEVSCIVIDSTGAASNFVLTLRDSTTDKISIVVSTSAETKIISFESIPARFATNLNLNANGTDSTVRYTIIYQAE
jgi:hypothetical protein